MLIESNVIDLATIRPDNPRTLTPILCPDSLSASELSGHMRAVADNVHAFNNGHHGAMYERTVDLLTNIFVENRAVLLLDEKHHFAYFGAIEPRFSEEERQYTGYQLVESVNLITRSDMRGSGIGTLGFILAMEKAHQFYDGNVITYLTTMNGSLVRSLKDSNKHSEGKWDMQAVSFHENPYLAGLTCIYHARNQDPDHNCTDFRRTSVFSTETDFDRINQTGPDKICEMPCTLVVSDLAKTNRFQANCMRLHRSLMGEDPVVIKPGENLSDTHVLKIGAFYEALHAYAHGPYHEDVS